MTKLIINNNEDILLYPVKSDSFANISNVLDEWIRFLSYLKPEELLYLNELNSKILNELTTQEIEQYLKIKKQRAMSELFVKYRNRDCTKEEHDQVIKFMDNSLKSFMRERLTEEEIKKSYILLGEFEQMSKSELNEYIDKQKNNYYNLNVFEAYILYEVREISYNRDNSELNDRIRSNQIERENKLRKSIIRNYGLR